VEERREQDEGGEGGEEEGAHGFSKLPA
jgi:hypothetical protein